MLNCGEASFFAVVSLRNPNCLCVCGQETNVHKVISSYTRFAAFKSLEQFYLPVFFEFPSKPSAIKLSEDIFPDKMRCGKLDGQWSTKIGFWSISAGLPTRCLINSVHKALRSSICLFLRLNFCLIKISFKSKIFLFTFIYCSKEPFQHQCVWNLSHIHFTALSRCKWTEGK